ncbi:MAG: isoprenoid biosynthesis protein ElbB [Verrucomicrobia bacterium Tous-C9LFEB]|nr:MAG: isoprenoid biosynthesis protein ElbB [Verrucomicrobia bacterium Tous-C9LFEB]
MKKIAVILSGCGVYDGAEIHESVLVLLALDRAGAQAVCAAPDCEQLHVINHASGEPVSAEKRFVLIESARIARGQIQAVRKLDVDAIDAVILPGGFGAAKNISNFAVKGEQATVNKEVAEFLISAQQAGKPIGFACIAPAIAAQLFGSQGVHFTIGNDATTAQALQKWGGQHINCAVDNIIVDTKLKIVTTPAYMLAGRITEAEAGINKMVAEVLKLA